MEITPRGKSALSFGWGFGEASFFFLVPDIWLSRIALADFRAAMWHIAFATLGAVLGGIVMYACGQAAFAATADFLRMIPAISGDIIDDTGRAIEGDGFSLSLLSGMATGIPYKIYAAWAGHLAVPLPVFLLASALMRCLRFLVVAGLFYASARMLSPYLSAKNLIRLHAAVWVLFYLGYFWAFGGAA